MDTGTPRMCCAWLALSPACCSQREGNKRLLPKWEEREEAESERLFGAQMGSARAQQTLLLLWSKPNEGKKTLSSPEEATKLSFSRC